MTFRMHYVWWNRIKTCDEIIMWFKDTSKAKVDQMMYSSKIEIP